MVTGSMYSSVWAEPCMHSTSGYIHRIDGSVTTQAGSKPLVGNAVHGASSHLRTIKTGSFLTISREVMAQAGNVTYSETISEHAEPRYVRRPGGDPIGQITPIGDVLVPMLLCAAGYVVIKSKLISKILHYAKRK